MPPIWGRTKDFLWVYFWERQLARPLFSSRNLFYSMDFILQMTSANCANVFSCFYLMRLSVELSVPFTLFYLKR